VKGGGLSMGDLHFSQGDGEITFCGAIEMAGLPRSAGELIKGGMKKYGIKNPIFKPSPIDAALHDYLIFEGISVDESGKQHYLDAHVAYRQACLNAIEYLKKFGYTGEQAYAILGTAPVEGHISGIVDIPNACATLWLPTRDLRLRHPCGRSFHRLNNSSGDGPGNFRPGYPDGLHDRIRGHRRPVLRQECEAVTQSQHVRRHEHLGFAHVSISAIHRDTSEPPGLGELPVGDIALPVVAIR
jgi:hypothetical protein